jgi:RNase P subunit RPR2
MDEAMDSTWQALSEEILSGVKGWRLAHPKATFREIEQLVHERVSRLEARLVQDAALASAAKEWKEAPAQERPVCLACGTTLVARGKHTRRLQGVGGQEVTLSRSYGTCPTCGVGLFPPG